MKVCRGQNIKVDPAGCHNLRRKELKLFSSGYILRASQPCCTGFFTDVGHMTTYLHNGVIAYESDHILQEEKKSSAGRTVPVQ